MQKYINLSDLAQVQTKQIKNSYQKEGKQNLYGSDKWNQCQELTKEGGLFEDVGLSTLMDISMSSIRAQPLEKKGAHSIEINLQEKQSFEKDLQADISEMRRKLRILNQRAVKIGNTDYSPLPTHSASEVSYLKEIRSQIRNEQIKKGIKLLVQVKFRQFIKDVLIFDAVTRAMQKKNTQAKKSVFAGWAAYVREQGEKKCMMEAIRKRIVQKRQAKQAQLKEQVVKQGSQVSI